MQYIKQYFPTTTSKKHVVVCLIVCASIGVVFFGMSTQMAHAVGLEDVRDGILRILTQASLLFARLCMAMAIFFLRFFIQLGAYNGFLDAPIVRLGWVMLRDIANMFFVVALLVIAFATILGRESYEWKKAMVKLVLVAILVNFSLLICGIVLDAAHVFTVTFINAIAPVAAGNLITMFNLGDMERIIADSSAGGSPDVELALFGGAAVALFFSAMAALTIGAYCIILLYRMVAIWSLLIFSPLAFVMSVLPATESYFEEWKSEFTKNILSAPIAVFFLWLAFATMGANSAVSHIDQYSSRPLEDSGSSNTAADTSINNISGNTQTNSVSLNVASTWANMAGFLVAMAFLLKGVEQVQSLGVRGAGWLDSAQSFAKNVATIGSGVALGGWLLGKGRDLGVNTAKNVGLAVGTQTGVVQAWKRTFTGQGFFAGAGQRAEARLERLDEEKSNKEAMQKALGRRDRSFVDVVGQNTLGRVGLYKTAEESRAISAVRSNLAKSESDSRVKRIDTEKQRLAEEGKLDSRLPNWASRSGGGKLSERLKNESKFSIEVEQSSEALSSFQTARKRAQTKDLRLEEDERRDDVRARELVAGNLRGFSSKTKQSVAASLKEIKALERKKKSVFSSESEKESIEKEIKDKKEQMKKTIKEDKVGYTDTMFNDQAVARAGKLAIHDAALQRISAKVNAGDETDSLEGVEGYYDVDYAKTEFENIKNALGAVEKKLFQDAREKLEQELADGSSEKAQKIKAKLQAALEEVKPEDPDGFTRDFISQEAFKGISEQERALAYQNDPKLQEFVRFQGELYNRIQQRGVGKAKNLNEKLGVEAADVNRALENKTPDEVLGFLKTSAQKVITNGDRFDGDFNLHVEALRKRWQEVAELREKKDLTDDERKALENATQDAAQLVAAGIKRNGNAFGAFLQNLEGFNESGLALDNNETLPKALVALLSGQKFTKEFNAKENEDYLKEFDAVEKRFKDKRDDIMTALRVAAEESGAGFLSGQFGYGINQKGRRVIGLTRLASSGVQLAGDNGKPPRFSTGTTKSGAQTQEETAANIYAGKTIETIRDVRELFETGNSYGLGGARNDKTVQKLIKQISLIRSGQIDSAQWRRLGGGTFLTGAYRDNVWHIAETAYKDTFVSLFDSWQAMLNDVTKTPAEHQDIERRIRQMLLSAGVEEVAKDVDVASATGAQMAEFMKNMTFKVGGPSASEERLFKDKSYDFTGKSKQRTQGNNANNTGGAANNTSSTSNNGGTNANNTGTNTGSTTGNTGSNANPSPAPSPGNSAAPAQTIPSLMQNVGGVSSNIFSSSAQVLAFKTFSDMRKALNSIAEILKTNGTRGKQMATKNMIDVGFNIKQVQKLQPQQIQQIIKTMLSRIDDLERASSQNSEDDSVDENLEESDDEFGFNNNPSV